MQQRTREKFNYQRLLVTNEDLHILKLIIHQILLIYAT